MTARRLIEAKYDDLADRLIKDSHTLFGGYSKRSLGNYIGNINRGVHLEWWRNRPAHARALAEMLGWDDEDLGLHPPAETHLFYFQSFPSLRPLDLSWEKPVQLGRVIPVEQQSYTNDEIPLQEWAQRHAWDKSMQWLQVEDDLEFKLLHAAQRQARHQEVVHLSSLNALAQPDLDQLRRPDRLLLFVDHPILPAQLTMLRELRQTHATRIVSRHAGEGLDQLERWHYQLWGDWRQRLIQWIADRASPLKTRLQAKDAIKLLRKHDPYARLLLTTSDIYDLCHLSHLGNASALDTSDADDSQRPLVASLLGWSKKRADTYARLARVRWFDTAAPWHSPLNKAQWQALLSDRDDFSTLEENGHLVHAEGGYTLGQPTALHLLLRDMSARHIRANHEIWQLSCYDPTRSAIIDAALDTLAFRDLCRCAEAIVTGPALGKLAPAVKLFLAIGRRLPREQAPARSRAVLAALATLVVEQITKADPVCPPWSCPPKNATELLEWLAACWAWSTLPAGALLDAVPRWLFPGWSGRPLIFPSDVSRRLYQVSEGDREDAALDCMLQLAPKLLSSRITHEEMTACPPCVRLCLLSLCTGTALSAEFAWAWWHGILWNRRMESLIMPALHGAAAHAEVAANWWPSLLHYVRQQQAQRFNSFNYSAPAWFTYDVRDAAYSAVISWVLQQLERQADTVLAGLSSDCRRFLLDHPKSLPIPLQRPLLRDHLREGKVTGLSAVLLFQHFGAGCAPELPPFIDDSALGKAAAQALWAWDPSIAQQMLSSGQSPRTARRELILATPVSQLRVAAQALSRSPELLEDIERIDWIRRNLPYSGLCAAPLAGLLPQ